MLGLAVCFPVHAIWARSSCFRIFDQLIRDMTMISPHRSQMVGCNLKMEMEHVLSKTVSSHWFSEGVLLYDFSTVDDDDDDK